MRKTAGTWVVRIFLFVLALSFVAWGVGDIFRGRVDTSVATVGSTTISMAEFETAMRRELQRLQQQLGTTVTMEQAAQLGLVDATLQRLIDRVLFDQAAGDLGLVASDQVVAQEIRENPAFHGSRGEFDRLLFEQIIANQGWNEPIFVEMTRRDLIRDQLVGSLVTGVRAAPEALAETMFRYRLERRVVTMVTVPPTAVGPAPEPSAADLEAFHQANAQRFTAPERRAISYLDLRPEDVLDEIEIAEADVRAEYEADIDRFVTPERRTLQQIVYPDEAAAQAAYDRLREGGEFLAVAKETRGASAADLSLGTVARDELPEPLAEAAFNLPVNGISAPVKSPFGWHLLRVTEIKEGSQQSFESVQAELRRELALREAGDALYRLSNRLQDELAGGASLEQAAATMGLKLHKVDAVDRSGKGPGGETLGLPSAEQLLDTAFEAPVGDPRTIETAEGGYLVVRVDDITPAALRPLDEIRAEVVAAWQQQQLEEAAAKRAEVVAENVRSGGTLAAAAAEIGGEPVTTEPFTRTGAGAQTPLSPSLIAAVFGAATGDLVTAPAAQGGGQVVAQVVRIDQPDPETDRTARERIATAAAAGIADDLIAQYRQQLVAEFGVSVNQQNLQSLF